MIKVEVYGFLEADKELRALGKKAGKVGADFTDEAARVAVQTVVRNVQPFGTGAKARKQGEAAILKDVGRAFQMVSNVRAVKPGVISSRAEALTHLRNVGRANKRVPSGVLKKKVTQVVWQDLVRTLQAKVGSAKGAFTSKSSVLGLRPQKWITRHKGKGRGSRKKVFGGAEWKFRGDAQHLSHRRVMGEAGIRRSLKKVEPNLRRHFNRLIKSAVRKSERRING